MNEVYASISFIELAKDIFVPYEWPIGHVYDLVLSSAKEVIMHNNHEELVLQVNGIPARLYQYFHEHRFYHVFKKICKEDVCGSYVYDIALTEDQNSNKIEVSTETDSCDDSKLKRRRPSSGDYTISYYYVPHSSRQELLNTDAHAHAMQRRAMRHVKRASQKTLDNPMSDE